MSTLKKDLSSDLKSIVQYCHDSIKGYDDAAEAVKEDHPQLAASWKARAMVRQKFAEELQERQRCIGDSGEPGGSVKGSLHRGLLKLKDVFSSDDTEAVIEECIRGEEQLLTTIRETLIEDTVDGGTQALLIELRMHTEQSINELRTIKA